MLSFQEQRWYVPPSILKACSSVVERCHYMAEVGGSTPSAPNTPAISLTVQ